MKHLYEFLVVFRHTVTGAGLGWKQCGKGRKRCGAGAGKNSQLPVGAGLVYILRVQGGSGQKISTCAGL